MTIICPTRFGLAQWVSLPMLGGMVGLHASGSYCDIHRAWRSVLRLAGPSSCVRAALGRPETAEHYPERVRSGPYYVTLEWPLELCLQRSQTLVGAQFGLHAILVEIEVCENVARMVSGGMKCIKYLLFVFNLIFFLAGLGLVALGAVAQVKFNEYSEFFRGEVNLPAIFLIVTGSVIFIISFFGCVGAYKENYCMVCTYAVLLGFVLLLEIITVFVAYILNIQINLVKPLENTMTNYLNPKHSLQTKAWNSSQKELHCCGVHSYRDWVVNPILNQTGSVPDACCVVPVKNCGLGLASAVVNVSTIYTEGCFDKVVYWAGEHNPYIRGAVAGLGVLELLCVVFACCLARSILREYEAV